MNKEELIKQAVNENKFKIRELKNLDILLKDFVNRKNVTFYITNYEIPIAYKDFEDGYEEFIPLVMGYIQGEFNAIFK